jgi:hypothetical protein
VQTAQPRQISLDEIRSRDARAFEPKATTFLSLQSVPASLFWQAHIVFETVAAGAVLLKIVVFRILPIRITGKAGA